MARNTVRRFFLRGVVAAVAGVGIATGAYPVAPQLALAVLRRVRGKAQPTPLGRLVAGEWALSAAFQAARPLGFLGVALLGREARGPRPIVFLHGYAQSQASFLVLAHRLRRRGLGPLRGFEYWTLGRVERAARQLARYVEAVRRATGAPTVDLVGHSMGGVVARAYVTLLKGAPWVENLVTIGSPHGGTRVSSFGIGWPSEELAAGSRFLQALAARPAPRGVRMTCIWSRADGLVSSSAEAHVDGAEELIFDDLGHMGLLASRRVAEAIGERLARPGAR